MALFAASQAGLMKNLNPGVVWGGFRFSWQEKACQSIKDARDSSAKTGASGPLPRLRPGWRFLRWGDSWPVHVGQSKIGENQSCFGGFVNIFGLEIGHELLSMSGN